MRVDDEDVAEIENKHYKVLCNYAAEFIHMGNIDADEIKQRMKYKNIELMQTLLKEHKYVCCYCGHMAGYEWFVGLPLWIKDVAMCNFYQASNYELLDNWICKRRSQFGAININIKYPLRKILQLKEEIEHGHSPYNSMIIGSLADLSPKSSSSSTEATLFDYKISVLTGTERIAKKLNAAFLYAKISLIRQGYYEIELKELKPSNPADENAYTIEYVKELEKNVKEQPELWMMWHRNLPLIEVH